MNEWRMWRKNHFITQNNSHLMLLLLLNLWDKTIKIYGELQKQTNERDEVEIFY